MRKFLLLLLLLLAERGYGQETIYFANGDKLPNARLTDATEQKVVFTVNRTSGPSSYTFQRSNVLMAFNKAGNFLVISALSPDGATARQQIGQFAASSGDQQKTDILVKTVPLTVIPGTISYESADIINYQTTGGAAASISKAELMMIIRRNGRHQLFIPPVEVASSLATIRQQIQAGEVAAMIRDQSAHPAVAPVAAPDAAPAVAPANSPVVVPAAVPGPVLPVAPAPVETNETKPRDEPTLVVVINNGIAASPKAEILDTAPTRAVLSEAEYERYREKALRRVDEFSSYLNVITDKTLPMEAKDRAIEQAARLFLPNATIEVTSKSRPGARRYPIRDYLSRLKLLPYIRAAIEWSEIQYVQELTQAADGNYYGTITGQQTFTGYGGSRGQSVLYSDVTEKNVKVKLQSYSKSVEGQGQLSWEVLLGNIGVANN